MTFSIEVEPLVPTEPDSAAPGAWVAEAEAPPPELESVPPQPASSAAMRDNAMPREMIFFITIPFSFHHSKLCKV